MSHLKYYKKLEFSVDDADLAKDELSKVLKTYEQSLVDDLTSLLLKSYHNSLMEIKRRKLIERSNETPPRIDYYLKSVLNYSLNKLHKGDRLKAFELLDEVKSTIVKI